MSLPIYVDLCRFMSMATDIGLERHMSPATYVTRVATYVNGPTYVDDATDICRFLYVKICRLMSVFAVLCNILTYVSAPNISRELPAPNECQQCVTVVQMSTRNT